MPEIGFGISSKGSLLDEFRTIPSGYLDFLRDGFSQIGALSERGRDTILAFAVAAAPYPSNVEVEPITAELGLEEGKAVAALSVCRLLVGILTLREETPEGVVEAAVAANLVKPETSNAILGLCRSIGRKRAEFKKTIALTSLQHALLPSLAQFEVRVDLRLDFADGSLSAAVPIALVHIDTDSSEKELWFQMTHPQVVALEAKLKQAREELERAAEASQKIL